MDERRGSEARPNGLVSRNSMNSVPTAPALMRQASSDAESVDFNQFRLTRILGEATYLYSKWRESDAERQAADNEYKKQQQYLENNNLLRQALEARRSKAERNAGLAKSSYVKAAREAEPLLQQIQSGSVRQETPVDEEVVRNVVKAELKSVVRFRELDEELKKLRRQVEKDAQEDLRGRLRYLTTKNDWDRMVERVQALELRPRQGSVSGDSRDYGVFGKDFEQFKTEMATRMAKQTLELRELGQRISVVEMEVTGLSSKPTQPNKNILPEDLAQVRAALEKAQEVLNDQYVTTQDLRFQLDSVVQGIRILNERVDEYDKRLEGVQSATERFFREVEAENNRRNIIFVQALDTMHDKITAEIASKPDGVANSPVVGFPSPRIDSPRPSFSNMVSPLTPNSINGGPTQINIMAHNMEQQNKTIIDLNNRIHQFGLVVTGLREQLTPDRVRSLLSLQPNVQDFCDQVSAHMQTLQDSSRRAETDFKTLSFRLETVGNQLQKHFQSTDNNFRETALHMESVKTRFGEHRRQLDTLITAWQETTMKLEELDNKYESLKEFLGNKIIPTIATINKAFPELFEKTGTNRSPSTGVSGIRPPPQIQAASGSTEQTTSQGIGEGTSNPIEL